MPSDWNYRIEPYRRSPDGDGWTPAPATEATVWFGFRERGEDHRCFGVFRSRAAAEKAMATIQERERQLEGIAREEGHLADGDGPEWDLGRIRPVTRGLIEAIVFKDSPTPAALNDFGIDSPQHLEAIARPLLNDEITFAQLDAAYGNGPRLTEMVNAAPSNPHRGIVFETPWDRILPRAEPPARKSVLGYPLEQPKQSDQSKERGREGR